MNKKTIGIAILAIFLVGGLVFAAKEASTSDIKLDLKAGDTKFSITNTSKYPLKEATIAVDITTKAGNPTCGYHTVRNLKSNETRTVYLIRGDGDGKENMKYGPGNIIYRVAVDVCSFDL
jgi:hypothetical protein